MNKYKYNPINMTPFKWFCLENFPFIEEDFDSLTSYGLYCKLKEYFDKVAHNVNEMGLEVQKLSEAFSELEKYVDNYFKNLDVQEEMNNKLDEMVEDGTLLNILSNYSNLIRVYETFSDVINDINNLQINQKIKVLGYNKINDGYGGLFIILNDYTDYDNYIKLNENIYACYINNIENNYFNNINYIKERHYNTDCYIATIPVNDEQGNKIIPTLEIDTVSPLKHAGKIGSTLTVNGLLSIVKPDDVNKVHNIPSIISNGKIIRDNTIIGIPETYKFVGITKNRELKEYPVNNTSAQYMLNDGCEVVFDTYYKLVENGMIVDNSNTYTNQESGVVSKPNPRMSIGVKLDGTLIIIACDGRTSINMGLTSNELASLFLEKGCINAWNLDGGGSTSFVYKGSKINRNIDNNGTSERNILYTLNFTKNIINKNLTDCYKKIGEEKQNLISQLLSFAITKDTIDITNNNLNDLTGKLLFGYGNSPLNAPLDCKRGYLINIPHSWSADYKLNYNSQIFIDGEQNRMFFRTQFDGIFKDWESITKISAGLYANAINQKITEDNLYTKVLLNSILGSNVSKKFIKFENNNLSTNSSFKIEKPGLYTIRVNAQINNGSDNNSAKYLKMTRDNTDITMLIKKISTTPHSDNEVYFERIIQVKEEDIDKLYSVEYYGNQNDTIVRCYIAIDEIN